MALVQLNSSFDTTAATRMTMVAFSEVGGYVDFAGNKRLWVTFNMNGDGTLRGFKLTDNGQTVFSVTDMAVSADYWADRAVSDGNLLPFFQNTLVGHDEILGSAGSDIVAGLGGNDRITGNAGNDRLSGDAGNDTLIGGAGNDTLAGGDGNDALVVAIGSDVATGGGGIDTLHLAGPASVNLALTGVQQLNSGASLQVSGVENIFGSTGADRLAGDAGKNLLNGGAGNDVLIGGGGDDRLVGGDGADRLLGGVGFDLLTGGAAADRFVFQAGGGADRIADFQNGLDRIEIASGAERFADLRIVDRGADVVIRYGADSITLVNVDHLTIDAADFIFT